MKIKITFALLWIASIAFSQTITYLPKHAVVVGDSLSATDTGGATASLAIPIAETYAEMIDTVGSSTLVLTAATPAKYASMLSGDVNNITFSGANDRLTIDAGGGGEVEYLVTYSVSASSSASNIILDKWIYKNGLRVTKSGSRQKIGTGSDVRNSSSNCIVLLAPGDYVELWFLSDTNTTLTIDDINVTLTKI